VDTRHERDPENEDRKKDKSSLHSISDRPSGFGKLWIECKFFRERGACGSASQFDNLLGINCPLALASDLHPSQAMRRTEYAEAFEAGFPATRRFLLSRGAGFEEAEEIAQAAWVRGWECRDQLRDPGLVGFWVNSIARNLFRAKFRSKPTVPIEGVDAPYSMNLEDIELRRLLDRCSRRDRQLLERSLEGYSAEEIARDEGITSTGIRVRMLRIRQGLRDQLSLAAV